MKRILVTGGAGFIGSHLCRRLLTQGNKIICMDSLLTGSERNIDDLRGCSDFSFIRQDVIEPIYAEVDEIYHLACPASPPHYQKDPVHTVKTCFLGALNVLELAKNVNAKVLLASTSEVYGEPLEHPQREDYRGNVSCIGTRACYDEGKRIAETLFFDYHRVYSTEIKVIRIFNTYGPYMDSNDGRVISNFIVQALRHKPLTIYGDGSQTRSFCYVTDLVDGILKMMESDKNFIGPVNLGNPIEVSMRKLAEVVLELAGGGSVCYRDLPQDDPTRRRPDISLAQKELGWIPSVGLEEGLSKTVNFFKIEQ